MPNRISHENMDRDGCPVYGTPDAFCWLTVVRHQAKEKFPIPGGMIVHRCLNCPDFDRMVKRAVGRRAADLALYQMVDVVIRQMKNSEERLKTINEKLQEKLSNLQILNQVSGALQRSLDLNTILRLILTGVTAGQGFGFNRAYIFLVDGSGKELEGRMAVGPVDEEEAGRIWKTLANHSLGDLLSLIETVSHQRAEGLDSMIRSVTLPLLPMTGLIGRTVLDKRPFNLRDREALSPLDEPFLRVADIDAFAVVPLIVKDEAIGALIADNKFTGHPIADKDVELLQTFANQASSAIENSRLHRQLERKLRELQESDRQLRENQAFLLKTERLAAIGKMAATLAHEIRGPLVSIGGYARSVLKNFQREVKQQDLEIIVDEVTRLESILAKTLDYSKEAQPRFRLHSINTVVGRVLKVMDELMKTKRIGLKAELPPHIPHLNIDASQIQQVIMNLVQNSIEAMKEEGQLTIKTGVENGYVTVAVSDTGAGISKKNFDKLFTPFFSTKPKGSGLGLSVSDKIVADHGGYLNINSHVGVGTTFTVYLPIREGKERRRDDEKDRSHRG